MGLGLGIGVWWPTQTSIIPGLLKALCARATYCENKLCTTATLEEIAAVRYTPPPPPPPPGLLLEDYPGASAAYSLRNLIDTTTSVVRVRRSYDNTESNFTATEITDGTLVDFTNQGWFQSAINPFTTFTSNGVSGFDATDDAGFGETFVNVENGASGDVVNITLDTSSLTGTWTIVLVDASGTVARSNAVLLTSGSNSVALTATGDFAFVDIFCQNPTTSISVTNFLASINVGDDGFVTTWYDQSGNGSNAVQATAANQPKLVSSGVVELSNREPCIVWDNANDTMTINTSYNSSNLLSIFSVYNKTTPIGVGDTAYLVIADNSISAPDGVLAWRDANKIGTYRSGGFSFGSIPYNFQVNSSFIYTLSQVNFYNNNSLVGSTTNSNAISNFNYTSIQIGRTLGGSAFKNQELIIYPSDQSANRNGIETNIDTNYGIFRETGLLADYPNASVAYSLRNLSNTTTNVVRVRRSSDNTEQNFTSTEITDGTLTTFTGANDGFVTIWYDQSGYTNDATQLTASEQPKLVTNGVVELDNGKPCLRYDTTGNDSFNLTTQLTDARSTFSVVNFVYNSGDSTQYLFGDGSSYDYASGNDTLLSSEFAASFVKLGDNKINNISSDFTTTARPLVQSLVSMIHTSSSGKISRISEDRTVNSRSLQGKLQEIIIYNTDQSLNRTGIETNINTEYTIY